MQRPKSPLLSHPERRANRSTWSRWLLPLFLGLSLPFALTACPGGAELEDPDRFVYGVAGASGTAGSAGAGGTSGAGAGGTAGVAGAGAGNAGSAGKTWTYTPPACDYQAVLTATRGCASAGCHNAATSSADLDLASPGVENRLIDVNAPHADIACPNPDGGVLPITCVPASCPTVKLVDRAAPANSWMLKKIMGATEVGECGDPMPIAPGMLSAEQRDCLVLWINAMAAAQ